MVNVLPRAMMSSGGAMCSRSGSPCFRRSWGSESSRSPKYPKIGTQWLLSRKVPFSTTRVFERPSTNPSFVIRAANATSSVSPGASGRPSA